MATLNSEISTLNVDSTLYKLYSQLFSSYQDAQKDTTDFSASEIDYTAEQTSRIASLNASLATLESQKASLIANNGSAEEISAVQLNIDNKNQEIFDAKLSIDAENTSKKISEASVIMMKNSAYATAKSIINTIGDSSSGGGSGDIAIFKYTRTSPAVSDDAAISNAIGDTTIKGAAIVIITDTSADESVTYGKTGFIYNNGTWVSLNGRIDANNVYLRGNIILAGEYTSVGNITKATNESTATFNTDGMSVGALINKIFSKIIEPEVTLPSISSLSFRANSETGATSVEAGTRYYPYWNATFNKGSYTYNDTGVSITSCSVIINGNVTGNLTSGTGASFVQQTDATIEASVTIEYSSGVIPKTNMGENSTTVQPIPSGSTSKTATIQGYRNMFYGYDPLVTPNYNSDFIRSLTGLKNGSSKLLNFAENTNSKRIVIAIPKDTHTIVSVVMPSSSNADVTAEFIKQPSSVNVEGANAYSPIAYDIWVYEPAIMAGTYAVTLS